MPDREKVMKGLELCTDISGRLCVSCPYYLDDDCPEQLCADALELLKEQETDIGNLNETVKNLLNAYTEIKAIYGDGSRVVGELIRCKDCQYYNSKPDSHGDRCDKIHWSRNDDWFCADGKRKS